MTTGQYAFYTNSTLADWVSRGLLRRLDDDTRRDTQSAGQATRHDQSGGRQPDHRCREMWSPATRCAESDPCTLRHDPQLLDAVGMAPAHRVAAHIFFMPYTVKRWRHRDRDGGQGRG